MDPEEEYAHRLQHAELNRTRLRNLSIQKQRRTRVNCTQQEACCVAAMNDVRKFRYIDQEAMNQINLHNREGPEILDNDNVLQ